MCVAPEIILFKKARQVKNFATGERMMLLLFFVFSLVETTFSANCVFFLRKIEI